MWLENKKYREIRTALNSGTRSALDRVLHDIAAEEKGGLKAPARCPVCHKDLKRGPLPYLEFIGAACPDYHGWWLSPEISKKLRDFLLEQISLGIKKARQFKILVALIAAGISFFALSGLFSMLQPHSKNSGIVFLLPMPPHSAAVQSKEEWDYLLNAAQILEEAISNRLRFEHALNGAVPSEARWKDFGVYRSVAEATTQKLKTASVPDPLKTVHGHFLQILENQIIYYAGLADSAKARPAFRAIHAEVSEAQQSIAKLYPNLDPQTRQALQERLFALEGV